MRTTDYHKLKERLQALEQQVEYWKAAYLKAIKHDDRIILKIQEAQHANSD
jgi:tetrahydromethanopterin S-methyltransferase subunit G